MRVELTQQELLDLGASALLVALHDDHLGDLSWDGLQRALMMRMMAQQLLLVNGLQPTELMELGTRLVGVAVGR